MQVLVMPVKEQQLRPGREPPTTRSLQEHVTGKEDVYVTAREALGPRSLPDSASRG